MSGEPSRSSRSERKREEREAGEKGDLICEKDGDSNLFKQIQMYQKS